MTRRASSTLSETAACGGIPSAKRIWKTPSCRTCASRRSSRCTGRLASSSSAASSVRRRCTAPNARCIARARSRASTLAFSASPVNARSAYAPSSNTRVRTRSARVRASLTRPSPPAARRAGRAASRPRACAGPPAPAARTAPARPRRSPAARRRRPARARPSASRGLVHARAPDRVRRAVERQARTDVRRERPHAIVQLARRPSGVEQPVGRGDLGRVGRVPHLRHGRQAPAGRSGQCTRQRRQTETQSAFVDGARVIVRSDLEMLQRGDRPGIERLHQQHRRHGGARLAGHQRSLDRRGPAPVRQRRGMQIDERQRVQERSRHEQAVGDHRDGLHAALLQERQRVGGPLGLRELQIERAGRQGDGRRCGLASPAGGPVGLAQHEADLEARHLGQLPERLRRPPVRACEADAHGHRSGTQRRGPGCGRSSASARRRSSGVVRSIVSTPSR